jgi:hypothetical protein
MRILSFALLITSAGLLYSPAQGQTSSQLRVGSLTELTAGLRRQSVDKPFLLAFAPLIHQNYFGAGAGAFAIAAVTTAAVNACDLNADGTVNVVDVQMSTNMYLGTTGCTATVEGSGVCNIDVINRIKTAALGGSCVTGPGPHNVTLNWTGSTSSNINGYNLYRSSKSGGPYTKVTSSPVTGTSYVDYNVDGGYTYYYVATAVDGSNNESSYSNQAIAAVPTP